MKKFFIALVVLLIIAATLVSCNTQTVETEDANDSSMFIEIEYKPNWQVVYHRETRVMYVISRGAYNQGTFTLLVNADGTPMIYEK